MTPCVMCKQEYKKEDLDFLGRCDACFKTYINLADGEKPNLGVPFTPGYN